MNGCLVIELTDIHLKVLKRWRLEMADLRELSLGQPLAIRARIEETRIRDLVPPVPLEFAAEP